MCRPAVCPASRKAVCSAHPSSPCTLLRSPTSSQVIICTNITMLTTLSFMWPLVRATAGRYVRSPAVSTMFVQGSWRMACFSTQPRLKRSCPQSSVRKFLLRAKSTLLARWCHFVSMSGCSMLRLMRPWPWIATSQRSSAAVHTTHGHCDISDHTHIWSCQDGRSWYLMALL